jgi:hypothetical protein
MVSHLSTIAGKAFRDWGHQIADIYHRRIRRIAWPRRRSICWESEKKSATKMWRLLR